MITVQLLGGASLRSDDLPIGGPPAQRHRIALLALVVAAWPHPLSRDRAMALLWPERDLAAARRLLNLALHVLRSALGEATIASTPHGLLFVPSHIGCDLHDLRVAIGARQPDRVVALYGGRLLDGFHLGESAEFGYWLEGLRSELVHAFVGSLLAVADRQARSGDLHGRVGTLRRLVAADPHSSAHALALMESLDAAGDRSAALQHAAEHARRVRADLDLDANPAVGAFAERLRGSPARHAPPPGSVPASRRPAVAVLPFVRLGTAAGHDYFADGITEDVIANLAKIHALSVISHGSVLPFRERTGGITAIGRSLGATAMLDGSVRYAGDRVRIVARLVDVGSERHLWAETYDRSTEDIFAIQSDVALQIASALRVVLSPDERARVRLAPTRDLTAYQLFLQGRRWFTAYARGASLRAIDYFDRAIARDPSFALAHAHRALTYIDLAEIGAMPGSAALDCAAAATAAALASGPELSEAHCTAGYLATMLAYDWATAEASFRRALELSPSNADAWDLYGRLCAGLGRYDEAIVMTRRAQELDPLAHATDVTTVLLRAGHYAEAVARAESAVEITPTQGRARATLGWAYFLSGREEEGLAQLERAVAVTGGDAMWLAQLGEAFGMAGQHDRARTILDELQERAAHGFVSPYHFAYVHAGLGEADRAIDWLERAVAEHTGPAFGIRGSFLFASLHGHPRFAALLRRINLA